MLKMFFRSLVCLAFASAIGSAQALQEIRISSQPALYGSLPFVVATEKDWWKEVGLKVVITNFPAGAPQIAASKNWDVGYTGSVPAVLGAVRHNLLTIAFSDDQSAANALMARSTRTELNAKNLSPLKGSTILLSGNSTGDLVTRACLRRRGLNASDVTIRSMSQTEIMAAITANTADAAALWAPNTYTLVFSCVN